MLYYTNINKNQKSFQFSWIYLLLGIKKHNNVEFIILIKKEPNFLLKKFEVNLQKKFIIPGVLVEVCRFFQ